jgi:large subunit ribosomal protein L18e
MIIEKHNETFEPLVRKGLTSSKKMSKRTGPSNEHTQQLIISLKQTALKEKSALWKRVANDLEKSTRSRRIVNIYKLDKYAKEGETVVVPGKVLGVGELSHKLNVAAFTFSKQAVEKINGAGGQTFAITDLLKQNPKGKNVRILG